MIQLRNHLLLLLFLIVVSCNPEKEENVATTIITKWPDDKRGAVSITYDDGIINQLTVARPIMNRMGLPGTFFIITGKVEGAAQGKFIGRSPEDIIAETANEKTRENNFFERASLIAFTGTTEAVDYHSRAGSLYESGRVKEAHALMDEAYVRLRKGELKNSDEVVFHDNKEDTTSWEDYRRYAAEGHEIASHTVTHARLAVLDEPNLLYELEQSKKDIEENLGFEYTFSVECPYGTENERVMEYAYDVYPALRNRMPAPYLAELNRGSDADPTTFEKEYVQWQRGPLTDISMDEMKSWVDITGEHDNIWLVLVFHGVNEFGWEPRTDEELEEYFSYIKDREANLWVATFGDVTKYIRERKDAVVETSLSGTEIEVNIKSTLFPVMYNVPLTFKTYVPSDWKRILVDGKEAEVMNDSLGAYVMYNTPLKGIKTTIIIESKAKE